MSQSDTPVKVGSSEGFGLEPKRAMLDAFDSYARTLVHKPHQMTPAMWPNGWHFYEAAWRAASAAERERCAKVAEDEDVAPTDDPIGVQECIAASIRRA